MWYPGFKAFALSNGSTRGRYALGFVSVGISGNRGVDAKFFHYDEVGVGTFISCFWLVLFYLTHTHTHTLFTLFCSQNTN
jgi:hypothetical protein